MKPTHPFGRALQRDGVKGERRQIAAQILQAALAAVDPASAIKRHVARHGDTLQVGDRQYDLRHYRRILVVGAGKASGAMAQAVEEILGDRISAGWVNVKDGYTAPTRRIHLHEASHPVPDERGLGGAQEIVRLTREAEEDDLLLCLISGGGSALMTLPVEGVSLADMQALTADLLRSGATINEMNAVRKHLSQIAGGNLARVAHPATVVSLLVSDVVGSPLDVIASGPTVPDTSTFADAYGVLVKYDLVGKVPAVLTAYLQRGMAGDIPETPKADDVAFARTYNLVVADNAIAAEAAIARAQALGLHTLLLSTYVEGEAREVGKVLASIGKEIVHAGRPVARPACVVAGGETTVTIHGRGRGGRNQELALSAAQQIAGLNEVMVVALATDGTDGPTDAAGAIAEGDTVQRAAMQGLDAAEFLAQNDSYHFFQALGDLLLTGPTNTNVNDLTLILVF